MGKGAGAAVSGGVEIDGGGVDGTICRSSLLGFVFRVPVKGKKRVTRLGDGRSAGGHILPAHQLKGYMLGEIQMNPKNHGAKIVANSATSLNVMRATK